MVQTKDEVVDAVKLAKRLTEGHFALSPVNGKAPVTMEFGRRKIEGKEIVRGRFRLADDVFYITGRAIKPAHAVGWTKTFRDVGLAKYKVQIDEQADRSESEDEDSDDDGRGKQRAGDGDSYSDSRGSTASAGSGRGGTRSDDGSRGSASSAGSSGSSFEAPVKPRGAASNDDDDNDAPRPHADDTPAVAAIRKNWFRTLRKFASLDMPSQIKKLLDKLDKMLDEPHGDQKGIPAAFNALRKWQFAQEQEQERAEEEAAQGGAAATSTRAGESEYQRMSPKAESTYDKVDRDQAAAMDAGREASRARAENYDDPDTALGGPDPKEVTKLRREWEREIEPVFPELIAAYKAENGKDLAPFRKQFEAALKADTDKADKILRFLLREKKILDERNKRAARDYADIPAAAEYAAMPGQPASQDDDGDA